MSMSYKYHQKATVWRKSDEVDLYGNVSWTTFVVDCRFQEGGRLVTGEYGQTTSSQFVVYTESDLLRNDDWVMLGVHTGVEPISGSHPIKSRRVAVNLRGTKREYKYVA
jgi:hypothetical protein